jgi:hypothetical protein
MRSTRISAATLTRSVPGPVIRESRTVSQLRYDSTVVNQAGQCYAHPMVGGDSDERFSRFLTWIAAVVALGMLGLGIYAVFHSTNGSGTAALLTIGPLALFVIAFRDRIRSMEFGGARVQLALRVKNSLRRAFKLRLAGDYEQAQAEIEDAFDQFVSQEPRKVRKAYAESKEYRAKVLKELGDYVELKFQGQVLGTAASVSFLPLIDAVMKVDGPRILQALKDNGRSWCPELIARVEDDGVLRTAVIVRPGPKLDVMRIVEKLDHEVAHGALEIDCFLLVQNCKESESQSRLEFCRLVNERPMHAKSMVWQPSGGSQELQNAFLNAIMTICDPSHCGFSNVIGNRPTLSQFPLQSAQASPTGR